MIRKSLPGQAWAWRFHFGLQEIERAYKASRAASEKELEAINAAAAAHQAKVDAGEAVWTEEDEDGQWVYDYGEELGERIHDAEQVLTLVRNAFVITLHHFIEQRIGAQLPKKSYDHKLAVSWLKQFGWTPMERELDQLRLAANCAKHSEGSAANRLNLERPDMFDQDLVIKWGEAPSYDSLKLTDAHVDEFFKAVKASVPRMPPVL